MAKKTRSGVYKAKEGFATPHRGQMLMVGAGALVPNELPYDVMDGREHLFEDISAARTYQVAEAAVPVVEEEPVAEEPVVEDEAPPKAGAGSSRDAWVEYAGSKGVEVTDDMTRDDIVEAVEAYEKA